MVSLLTTVLAALLLRDAVRLLLDENSPTLSTRFSEDSRTDGALLLGAGLFALLLAGAECAFLWWIVRADFGYVRRVLETPTGRVMDSTTLTSFPPAFSRDECYNYRWAPGGTSGSMYESQQQQQDQRISWDLSLYGNDELRKY